MFRPLSPLAAVLVVVSLAACSRAEPSNVTSQSDFDGKSEGLFVGATPTAGRGAVGSPSSTLGANGYSIAEDAKAVPAPYPTSVPALGQVGSPDLQGADRKVNSTAALGLEVETVGISVTQVRTIAEGLGGYAEKLSSSGDETNQRADIPVRVPQPQFFTALERIQALGKARSQNVGSQDVSEQFVDLQARLKSAQTQKSSYLALLNKASTVNDILTIERELTRVRAEIERLQGQLAFLERRVAMATISVSLFTPAADKPVPPAGMLTLGVGSVGRTIDEIKALVPVLQGMIDSSIVTINDDGDRATIVFRVFSADFQTAMQGIEKKGDVESKEIREGAQASGLQERTGKPDARIQAVLVEDQFNMWMIGGIIFAVVLVLGGITAAGFGIYHRTKRGGRLTPISAA